MNENKNTNEQVLENETAEETVVEEIFAEEAEKAPEIEMDELQLANEENC